MRAFGSLLLELVALILADVVRRGLERRQLRLARRETNGVVASIPSKGDAGVSRT